MGGSEGFTQVPNKILDKLIKSNLNGSEMAIVLLVIRNTYGWKRGKAELSRTFIAKKLNKSEKTIQRSLSKMINEKVVKREQNIIYSKGGLICLVDNIDPKTDNIGKTGTELSLKTDNIDPYKGDRSDPQLNKELNIKESIKEKNVFLIPKYEDIEAYCIEMDLKVDPKRFYDYYEQRDWKTGKTKMTDWRQAISFWEQREKEPLTVDINEKRLEKIVEAVAIDTSDWGFEVLQEFKDILSDFGDYPKFGDFGKAYLNYVKYLKDGENHKERALKAYQALDFYEKEQKYEDTDPRYYKSLENFFATSVDEYTEKRSLENEHVLFCPGGAN